MRLFLLLVLCSLYLQFRGMEGGEMKKAVKGNNNLKKKGLDHLLQLKIFSLKNT